MNLFTESPTYDQSLFVSTSRFSSVTIFLITLANWRLRPKPLQKQNTKISVFTAWIVP
jgi:hypothetical protein